MSRASASLVILSPLKRILMLKRPSSGSFPELHAFPGGALDATDPSLEYCALRETFEETGVRLHASTKKITISPRSTHFKQQGDLPALAPISEWTTPDLIAKKEKRSFKTQFFLYQSENEVNLDGFVPNEEIQEVEWISPEECLNRFRAGQILLYPPQFYILSKLNKHPVNEVVNSLRTRVVQPKMLAKDGDFLEMDWGEGEIGKLKFKAGRITGINFVSKI